MCWLRILALTAFLATTYAYSGGAPVDVCKDMTPKHPAPAQSSKMPYTVTTNTDTVSQGGVVKVTIAGTDGFKGFLLEARQGDTPVGKFLVADNDKLVKTINCDGEQNAATHKNSEVKNNLTVDWQPTAGLKGQVQLYVTVALDGGTYWVRQPTAKVTVN